MSILLATGAHGPASRDAVAAKVGPEAASQCRLLSHDDAADVVKVGRTSFGTRVLVDPAVVASDYVIGVGGIYPQHSTGFGGGSKLALGVLGRASIARLHYSHTSMEGSYETDNDFRRDLDEVADLIGLRTSISAHVDADRRLVRLVCGDHRRYYAEAATFAHETFRAPPPGDADVVVSNAYPIDVSLTFMRSKGVIPLVHAKPTASRILISACPEGVGRHRLFPFVPDARRMRYVHMARRARAQPNLIPRKLAASARRLGPRNTTATRPAATAGFADAQRPPIWLYAPGQPPGAIPTNLPGMTAVYDWDEVVGRIACEQTGSGEVRVVVYPCAPLHVLDLGSPPALIPSALGTLD